MVASSRSRQQTSTSTTTQNVSRNLNVQDVEGVTAVAEGGGSVSIVQTDHNAFDRAAGLAELSVATGAALQRDQTDFLGEVLAGARGFFSEALTFTRETADAQQQTIKAHQETIAQQAQPADARLQDVSAASQRTVLLAVGIVAAAIVAFAIFRK